MAIMTAQTSPMSKAAKISHVKVASFNAIHLENVSQRHGLVMAKMIVKMDLTSSTARPCVNLVSFLVISQGML